MFIDYSTERKIYFDTTADLSELEEYAAEKGLKMGSLAVCCEDGSEYLLNSSGKWCRKGGAA